MITILIKSKDQKFETLVAETLQDGTERIDIYFEGEQIKKASKRIPKSSLVKGCGAKP